MLISTKAMFEKLKNGLEIIRTVRNAIILVVFLRLVGITVEILEMTSVMSRTITHGLEYVEIMSVEGIVLVGIVLLKMKPHLPPKRIIIGGRVVMVRPSDPVHLQHRKSILDISG
jgi:hypothetical protein